MTYLIKIILLWLSLCNIGVLGGKARKVLPLDHHRRTLRSHNNDGGSLDKAGKNGGYKSGDHVGSAGAKNSVQAEASTDARSGRKKHTGTGFLGDGLNIIGGRKNNGGSAHGSPVHTYTSWRSHKAPSPTLSGHGISYKSGGHTPTVNSVGHAPTHVPLSPSGKGQGKGSSSSSSKSKGKSGKSGKSKGKSKSGKSKGKGKGGKSKSSYSEESEAARPIEATLGRDEIYKSATTWTSPDDPPEETVPTRETEPPRETVDLTSFGVIFDLADGVGTPSSDSYGMAIEVTVGYLNTYMGLQYEGKGLKEFQTTAISTIYRNGAPQIDFEASATFEGVTPPTTEKLDNNVANAFSGANLALYLSMLQNLPESNAFRTVSGARLTNPARTGTSRSRFIGDVSTVGKAGIAGAIGAGGLLLFAIGFMLYGKQRKPVRSESSNRKKARSKETEQATVMGETTCSSSTASESSSTLGAARIPTSIADKKRKPPSDLQDVSLSPSLG